jgi:ribosomal protein L11 methyltransferase
MNSIQITIEANEAQQEILISELSELGADGFEQTNTHLIAYFTENDFVEDLVYGFIKDYPYTIQVIQEKNWNEEWESNFQPVIVDSFCAVRASFHERIRNVKHEIIITPKMSFGTGHHATTYMMLQQMQEIDFKDKTVFDFGTGTGVLAILAEKLEAASITAIDVDDWSMANAAENIAANQCRKIHLYKSSEIPQQEFDIILANINRNVIVQHFNEIVNTAKPGSSIMLSGLLTTDEEDIVKEAKTRNIRHIKQVNKNNWVCLLFVK